ncbi:MAG: transcriptional regulator [Erysipelotrichaceae bacterium]|nr:transcriptional regulator [Erysipelotrichaceae bacterium]
MPNRILKESICLSEEIDQLSWFEEVLFYRLITKCDDFGRYDGRAKVIKGTAFPLKDITTKDIEKALKKLVAVGLVTSYEVDEKPYLQLRTWQCHQQIRNSKSKYPDPEAGKITSDINCNQLQSIDINCTRNPIQSNPNPNPNHTLAQSDSPSVLFADVESIPLNTGEEWLPTEKQYAEYCRLYPSVDVKQQFREMRGWCIANPAKRKTKKGIARFVNGWLSRTQDKGSTKGKGRVVIEPPDYIRTYAEMEKELKEEDLPF